MVSAKKLTAALAVCVLALCWSLRASGSQDWFNGGIGTGWPNAETMFGGEWCEKAEEYGQMDHGILQISVNEDSSLVFKADNPKSIGPDADAKSAVISFRCAFQPFSQLALPDIPADAKGAVILVTEMDDPDEAEGGTLYYAAYDEQTGKNAWMFTGIAATTNDFVNFSMRFARGDSGFLDVEYTIGGSAFSAVVLQSDTTVKEVDYMGVGRTDDLKSQFTSDKYQIGETTYADFASMNAALKDGDEVTMLMDDTISAEATISKSVTFHVGDRVLAMLSGLRLTIAADVAFTAAAAENLPPFYVRADCILTLPTGSAITDRVSGEDYARVAIDGVEWMRYGGEWRQVSEVTMRFFYPGYFEKQKVTLRAPYGRFINDDELDSYLNDVNTDESVQDFYWDADTELLINDVYWFDGTWSNEEGELVDFPVRYTAGDFYPNSTVIVHRITYDMGEAAGATHDNPTGYSIDTRFVLGDAVAPTGSELAFQGWTDEDGKAMTEVDPIAIGRETKCLYDFTLYANWGPKTAATATVPKTTAVMPGELAAYYDTAEAAQAAAAALNADKSSHICAPSGFTGSVADYAENFEAVAAGTAITIKLTDAAKEDLAGRIDDSTSAISVELANPAVRIVTVTDAEPGFYYSVLGGTAAGGVTTEGNRELAQEETVELAKPELGPTDKAFYKVKASVRP